jgi:hypothetical protein
MRKKLMIIYVFVNIFFIHESIFAQASEQVFVQDKKLIIVDTTHRERFLYQTFIQMFEAMNWNVKYLGVDQVMDLEGQDLNLSGSTAFFIFGIEFLKAIGVSAAAQKVLTLLNNFCQNPNKLVGLIFPSLNINPQVNLIEKLEPVFSPLGIQVKTEQNKCVNDFITVVNAFLTKPPESRPIQYHTTLVHPHAGTSFYTPAIKQILDESAESLKVLPASVKYSQVVSATMPYGVYWFNPIKQNHVFITNQTMLAFSGITENCHFCPCDFNLRKEMLAGIRDMIIQIPTIKPLDTSQTSTQSNGKDLIEAFGHTIKIDNKYPLRKTAWMELCVFEPLQFDSTVSTTFQDDKIRQQQLQQDQLIRYIADAKLDALWVSLCPNMFYSPVARKISKENALRDTISVFTKKLKTLMEAEKLEIPKILVGFEITNNIYEPNLPKPCARDIYDNTYFDVPDPLNQNFWCNEVQQPFEKFAEIWKNPEINNGIPLSGLMIDLEMYCRRTAGIFLSTMGFNNRNFNSFLHRNKFPTQKMSINEMARLCIDKKLTSKYFDFLEQRAFELGQSLKNSFAQKIPDCIIACYMPNILISWFYKGLYQGLSDDQHPVHLFSFNAEFLNHKKWFEDNKINATHSSVLLLSKIVDKQSFQCVDEIQKHHHGIWFNRWSRTVEPRISNDWTAVEKLGIPDEMYPEFMQHIAGSN